MTGGWGHWVTESIEFRVMNLCVCTAQHMACSAPTVWREAWSAPWTGKGLRNSEAPAGEERLLGRSLCRTHEGRGSLPGFEGRSERYGVR